MKRDFVFLAYLLSGIGLFITIFNNWHAPLPLGILIIAVFGIFVFASISERLKGEIETPIFILKETGLLLNMVGWILILSLS